MMLDLVSQLVISAFGAAAIFLSVRKQDRWRRWGVLCGLASQPAWYMQMVLHRQWGMFPVFTLYTLSWLSGIWTLWVLPWRERRRLEGLRRTGWNRYWPYDADDLH